MYPTQKKPENENLVIKNAYDDLLSHCKNFSETDLALINKAFEKAEYYHRNDYRKSGEPYILHPIAVAKIVAKEIGVDAVSIACALLHDTVEDTNYTLEEIEQDFNFAIKHIIDGLTKIKGVYEKKDSTYKVENIRKILIALGDDIRVIIVKIADRLHNMRTLDSMVEKKQLEISSETMYLYIPIAHRLGLYRIKSELEDLCMKFTQREEYKEVASKLASTKVSREKFIADFIAPLDEKLSKAGLSKYKIFGRPKHIYSIWNKIKNKHVPFEEIYDLFAIRILIDAPPEKEKEECWKAYSVITDIYNTNPDRLRDWISNPKGNGYESLHTTVMSKEGKWVEVQIRTVRMDEIAERGVAAHWKYKGSKAEGKFDSWLESVREILKNPQQSAMELLKDFRYNLYEEELHIFTPKGELKILPKNSTVLDFAFAIHSNLGSNCIGGKINSRLLPISHKLNNYDQVEILTSKKQKPSEDWLNFTVTSKARTKIRTELKSERKKVAEDGKEIFERKMKSMKVTINQKLVDELVNYLKLVDATDLFYRIAIKQIDLNDLKALLVNGDKITPIKELKKTEPIGDSLHIEGKKINDADLNIFEGFANDIDYSVSKCCHPVAGDDVFGFITISKGINIHRKDCPNAPDLITRYSYRVVNIKWAKSSKDVLYLTRLTINGIDDMGLVNKLTSIISSELKINMRAISLNAKDGIFEGDIQVYVKDTKQANLLIKKLTELDGIYSVKRISNVDV